MLSLSVVFDRPVSGVFKSRSCQIQLPVEGTKDAKALRVGEESSARSFSARCKSSFLSCHYLKCSSVIFRLDKLLPFYFVLLVAASLAKLGLYMLRDTEAGDYRITIVYHIYTAIIAMETSFSFMRVLFAGLIRSKCFCFYIDAVPGVEWVWFSCQLATCLAQHKWPIITWRYRFSKKTYDAEFSRPQQYANCPRMPDRKMLLVSSAQWKP